MTLVNQDLILEYARNMGEFTTKEIAYRVHRDLDHGHITSTYRMLAKLTKWKMVERVGRRKENGCQWQTVWRVVL